MSGERGIVRNRWSINPDTLLWWSIFLPGDDPAVLVDWQRLALRAGEELGVYRVEAVPSIGYRRAEYGPLADYLEAHPERDDGPMLFHREHRAAARLAVADPDGTLVERDVTDLGELLARDPSVTPIRSWPPLQVFATDETLGGPGVLASVSTCTDIWLPWCPAHREDDPEAEEFADNTALAGRHAPRLNAFLERLRAHTLRLGGSWGLDRQISDRDLWFEVDERGVLLAAERPCGRVTELSAQDFGGDIYATLRAALYLSEVEPPPPPKHTVLRVRVYDARHELYRADRHQILQTLRHPNDPASALSSRELAADTMIEVDNYRDRFAFRAGEVLRTP